MFSPETPPTFALLDGHLTMIRLANDSTSTSAGTLEAYHVDDVTGEVQSFAKLPISGASSVRGLSDSEADQIVVVCETLTAGVEIRRLHSNGFDEIRANNSGMVGEFFRQYGPAYLALTFAAFIPMLIFVLAKLGIVTARFLIANLKYAILIIFIVAAVVTPDGSMVVQLIMAAPMIVLYFVSIGVAWLFGRRDPNPEPDAAR